MRRLPAIGPMRRLPAIGPVVLLLVATMAAALPARAAPGGAALRAERAELLSRIAVLTDAVEARQAGVVAAQQRRGAAEAAAARARDRLREHAVTAYIHAAGLADAARARNGVYADVMAEVDRRVVVGLDAALLRARGEETAAGRALHEARAAGEDLERARRRLEATIATVEEMEAEARRNAEARRQAGAAARAGAGASAGAAPTPRHRRATEAQASLLARWPFGSVDGLPNGLVATGEVVTGRASWYGPGFDGRPTASGAIYDQEGWTVASKELPLGTMLLVSRGGRSVLVLVNNRGPYVAGRVLDLSHAVAGALGTVRAGVADVRAEVVVAAR